MHPLPQQRHQISGHDAVTRLLHWVVAVVLITTLLIGLWMTGLPAGTEPEVARIFRAYSIHKTLGLGALGLSFLRIVWTLTHSGPAPLHPDRKMELFLARVTHWCLWIGMIVLPVTGFLHHSAAPGFAPILWPFPQTLPFVPADEALSLLFRNMHMLAGWLIMVALGLHLAGVLKHSLLDRDATLARMISGKGPVPLPATLPRPMVAILAASVLWLMVIALGGLTASQPDTDLFRDDPGILQPLD